MIQTELRDLKPGYYWAKWRIPADGTHEGELLCPSDNWEIVQVNANHLDWTAGRGGEPLSVSVPGVRETQWPDCFVWGAFVAPLEPPPAPRRGGLVDADEYFGKQLAAIGGPLVGLPGHAERSDP